MGALVMSSRWAIGTISRAQLLRVEAVDPTAHHVEQVFLVDRADRRAVERFDVVGRDLERRNCVDARVAAEQQRVVAQ